MRNLIKKFLPFFLNSLWAKGDNLFAFLRSRLLQLKKEGRQVAAATDKVFYHIFLTCKCFMVINVRWLLSLFYILARYQSSLISFSR